MIRLENEEEKPSTNGSHREAAGVIKLVDAQNNQFVMSKGKDSTVPHEDPQLIQVSREKIPPFHMTAYRSKYRKYFTILHDSFYKKVTEILNNTT